MDNTATKSILSVCNALNENSVEYLIVGGTAVAFHGYFRWSFTQSGIQAEKYDLDIWYNPTYDNYFKLLNALEQLGQNVSEFRQEKAPNPKQSFFRYEMENFTLDLLPKLKGLSKFSSSYYKREIVDFKQTNIHVLSFEDLIQEKKTDARPKDLLDIKYLIAKKRP